MGQIIEKNRENFGLFDDPYRFADEERSRKEIMTPEKLALSKEAAVKSR